MEQILESLSVLVIAPWKDETALAVWCVFLAVVGVVIYMTFRRATLGKALRALTEAGCTGPDTAKPASELKGVSLRALESRDRLIEKLQVEGETRYYLSEDRLKKANYFLKASAAKPHILLLEILGLYLLMVIVYYILPGLMDLLDSLNPFGK